MKFKVILKNVKVTNILGGSMLKIEEVNIEEIEKIIENRENRCKIYAKCEDIYIGVDNSTNDAWTEEFKNKSDVINWLNGDERGV